MVKGEKGGKKVFFNYFRKRHLEGTRTLSPDVFLPQPGASRRAQEKAAYTGSWAPPTAIAQAQHSFLEFTGPSPPLVSHWLSVIFPPLRDSANQKVLMGGAFSGGAERELGLAPLKTVTWLKEAGLFLN